MSCSCSERGRRLSAGAGGYGVFACVSTKYRLRAAWGLWGVLCAGDVLGACELGVPRGGVGGTLYVDSQLGMSCGVTWTGRGGQCVLGVFLGGCFRSRGCVVFMECGEGDSNWAAEGTENL